MAANPLLHASPASSTPKHRKAQNPHPNVGSVKANHELKQSKLATLKPEDKAGWKSFLCQSFLKLTGQTHVSHFEKYNPVTTEIAKQANQCFEGSLSTEGIHTIIWGYILQARDSWLKRKPCMHEEERDRFETVAEAAMRAQIDQVKRYNSVRKANYKREHGVKKLILHSSRPKDQKRWRRIEAVLGEHGQSLDDTDVEVEGSALVTTEPYGHWCFLSCILTDLDNNINELQSKIAAQHGKKHLAHPTQIRRQTGQKTQPKAIICLP
ncbi:hypothetical protein BT96DRAFT_998963 [Gymnopus androsaceus JB14]|uniref:Uncharacterized protein n=1 Tax=Gymnopus androsaceus JB14 TaxID=1447944 RepID=A0A6A4H9F1_9AGAR|nr:hypothetical protein BT96DRAFT_998963 [Gymnopus androsaceus JB14]